MNKQTIAGVILVAVALFDISPARIANFFKTGRIVTPVVVVVKPEQRLIEMTKPIAEMVSLKEDKDKLAVFINELGNRKYENVTMQQVNNIMTKAGHEFFGTSFQLEGGKKKYPDLAPALVKLIDVQEVDSQETVLNADQLKELSNRCKALSWALTQ